MHVSLVLPDADAAEAVAGSVEILDERTVRVEGSDVSHPADSVYVPETIADLHDALIGPAARAAVCGDRCTAVVVAESSARALSMVEGRMLMSAAQSMIEVLAGRETQREDVRFALSLSCVLGCGNRLYDSLNLGAPLLIRNGILPPSLTQVAVTDASEVGDILKVVHANRLAAEQVAGCAYEVAWTLTVTLFTAQADRRWHSTTRGSLSLATLSTRSDAATDITTCAVALGDRRPSLPAMHCQYARHLSPALLGLGDVPATLIIECVGEAGLPEVIEFGTMVYNVPRAPGYEGGEWPTEDSQRPIELPQALPVPRGMPALSVPTIEHKPSRAFAESWDNSHASIMVEEGALSASRRSVMSSIGTKSPTPYSALTGENDVLESAQELSKSKTFSQPQQRQTQRHVQKQHYTPQEPAPAPPAQVEPAVALEDFEDERPVRALRSRASSRPSSHSQTPTDFSASSVHPDAVAMQTMYLRLRKAHNELLTKHKEALKVSKDRLRRLGVLDKKKMEAERECTRLRTALAQTEADLEAEREKVAKMERVKRTSRTIPGTHSARQNALRKRYAESQALRERASRVSAVDRTVHSLGHTGSMADLIASFQ